MLSISRNVRPSVCICVCVFTFEVPFKRLFAPTSRSRMSNIFRDSESLRKSNGKKWSQIWTFLCGSGLKSPRQKKNVFLLILPYKTCWKPRFPMDERPLVEGYIANFGIYLDVFFKFFLFDDFFPFSKNLGFWVFLVHPTVVSVLLSASVERCFVSRMRDFFCILQTYLFGSRKPQN